MKSQKPSKVGLVNGHPLRMFSFERLEFPWVAFSDLVSALNYPMNIRAELLRQIQSDYGKLVRKIACGGEVLVIGPHPMTLELISPAIAAGLVPETAQADYENAASEFMVELTTIFPLPRAMGMITEAYLNTWGPQ